jgi:GNAT superfamily N-acetyltransferase
MGVSVPVEFRSARMADGDGLALVTAMIAEVEALYPGLRMNGRTMPAAGPDQLGPPAGTFLVGHAADGTPVCCGGLKRLPDGACEIKRMYVVPAARGRGVARQLLAALEDVARGLGYRLARLDTGPEQHTARRMYEAAGYVEIGNFNDNPVATYFAEKRL